jgi:type IV pilus assembly protein PilB
MEGDTLWVAMSDPANQFLKNVLGLLTGYNIKSYIASPKELKQAISSYYSREERFKTGDAAKLTHSYFLPLKQLGFTPRSLQLYEKHLENQKGCILIIGPEDSGKKTTVYASLKKMNFPDNDIVSIERTLDYHLDNVNQIEVTPQAGLDIKNTLEYVNQFNPNIVALENVQGVECWNNLGRMAEKGHLVIGTINTDQEMTDFLAGFTTERTDHYSLLEHLDLVVEQRLARAVCPYCKESLSISRKTAQAAGLEVSAKQVNIYEGKGCKVCNFTGYYGYTACYGLLPINSKIKDIMMQKTNINKIKKAVHKEFKYELSAVLQEKLLRGQIPFEEYIHLVGKDITQFKELKELKLSGIYWQMFERSGSVNAYLQYRGQRKN